MNEQLWGFNVTPLAAAGLRTTLPLTGTTTVGFTQPMTTPLATASLGAGLFQTR